MLRDVLVVLFVILYRREGPGHFLRLQVHGDLSLAQSQRRRTAGE